MKFYHLLVTTAIVDGSAMLPTNAQISNVTSLQKGSRTKYLRNINRERSLQGQGQSEGNDNDNRDYKYSVIHVGPHKTASTTLQKFLLEVHKDNLAKTTVLHLLMHIERKVMPCWHFV